MMYVGILIIIGAGYFIVKGIENRMVLILAGVAMSILAGKPFAALLALYNMMTSAPLIPNIIICMGFAQVLKVTGCDQHLIRFLTRRLDKAKFLMIPAATLITFFINTCITSASGVAAAVSAILVPVLVASGIHPVAAASAILAGTYGHVINPATSHNIMIAGLAKVTPVEVVAVMWKTALTIVVSASIITYIVIKMRKEDKGGTVEGYDLVTDFTVHPLKAIVPVVPIALLILASPQVGVIPVPKELVNAQVVIAMLFGSFLAWLVTRIDPQKTSRTFFEGIGHGYGAVAGIIFSASAFTAGMEAIGLTGALIEAMKQSQSVVRVASVFGPFLIAAVGGSGDASAIAFNQAVTPSAAQFGLTIPQLGSVAHIAGAIGRTMSPVAGPCIAIAGVAKVSTFEMAKRTAPAMLIGALIMMVMMF